MKCKICGNQSNNRIFKVKEMMFGLNEIFDYFECSACGCLQISEIPQQISKYYPPEYYSFRSVNNLNTNKIKRIIREKRDRYALTGKGVIGLLLNKIYPANHINFLVKANISIESKILDVGCGCGDLLRLLGNVGFKRLLGVDPFIKEDIKYDNGVKILKKEIHDLNEVFDLIMFNHSFEHIPDPEKTMMSISKLLSENGKCIIRIPTVSSFAWKKYNENWVQLDAPRHLFLYSIDSIKLLASESGLTLKDYYYDSTDFQFWGSEQFLKGIPLSSNKPSITNPKKGIFSKGEIKLFKKMAEDLNKNNLGDQATLYFSHVSFKDHR